MNGKKTVDKGNVFGALLTDLTAAFYSLSHELITAKLNVYGFISNSLKLINSFLSHRKQKSKIKHFYSSCEEILFAVPQCSY